MTRVIEIPTPRWVLYDKVRFGIKDLPSECPSFIRSAWDLADLVFAGA